MDINETSEKKLRLFARLLGEANALARVIGPSDEETIYREHVMDSLAALPLLEQFSSTGFVDVGTGGGLPGIAWGICRPDLHGVLVDSVGKKIKIVMDIAAKLGLKNIETVHARSEELAEKSREKFEIAAARAVSDSKVLAEYLSPLVKVGGLIIAFKGPKAHDELDIPPKSWLTLGLDAPRIKPYSTAGKNLNLVIWEKVLPCPSKYPRMPGEAKKNPWA
ncbi:MAG: 16S rRNA (guanine(527)-N(7))-methyltransferase RsmG [Synergistaceae bacterium]|nr:16S rRNA (guanine(527)-N(7))-methyltransferase RsmG [Synergistaceae bacterium]